MKDSACGFTIVELLIVIVVIGILAAISIVAYNGVSNSAHDNTVRADLSNLQKQIEIFNAENGRYPVTVTEFSGLKISRDSYDTQANNVYYAASTDGSRYAFGARSKSGLGLIGSSSGNSEPTTINGSTVAQSIDLPWGGDTMVAFQGYITQSIAGTAPGH